MILNYDKVMFHANNMTRDDDGELNYPHVENFINADVYTIAAYIYVLIGVLSLTEYGVRQHMTEIGFGNTAIVSLLINANCRGACDFPLWRRDDYGELFQQ
ncbi:hypothetical protein Q4610_01320 [Sphingobium sp. HBC34]|uniref:Uncharacterized protein n=1 Tax=Sphingobium cyanobacteriorum TaxID=3063954 RepID=A0ABT8ZGK9_9SPHN|nr:hypothetical protein [Sphingobium sp. HBC34]MDO7833674.1 hypothetical protein [Sphingobium sp. HBC34]